MDVWHLALIGFFFIALGPVIANVLKRWSISRPLARAYVLLIVSFLFPSLCMSLIERDGAQTSNNTTEPYAAAAAQNAPTSGQEPAGKGENNTAPSLGVDEKRFRSRFNLSMQARNSSLLVSPFDVRQNAVGASGFSADISPNITLLGDLADGGNIAAVAMMASGSKSDHAALDVAAVMWSMSAAVDPDMSENDRMALLGHLMTAVTAPDDIRESRRGFQYKCGFTQAIGLVCSVKPMGVES